MRLHPSLFKVFRSPAWLRSPVKKFSNNQDGVTAIEFALIALPFFALLMGIIEAGLYFFVSQVMDTGFRDAARQIRTGQLANATLEEFRTATCNLMNRSTGLFECGNLYIEKRVLAAYDSASSTLPIDGAGNFVPPTEWQYACGGKVVQVRAFYEWPSYANILGSSIANGSIGLGNGNILMNSTAVFRTEPYGGCI